MKKNSKIVVANWKMSPASYGVAKKLFDDVRKETRRASARIVICPPLLFARELMHSYSGSKISFGAQNVSEEEDGPFTGEMGARMLKEAGLSFVIVGHSERKAKGETDEMINKKILRTLAAGLSPVLCIGEKERDRTGRFLAVLSGQLSAALRGVEKKDVRKLIIAYEPVFAIGKGASDALPPREIEETAIFIRKRLVEAYGREVGLHVPVLYGGSVEPENGREIIEEGGVDGYLVGHASLSAHDFAALVSYAS